MSRNDWSRRRFLRGAVIGGAFAGASLLGTGAAAAGKLPQKAVNYRTTPMGNARCGTCAFFQGPSSCKLVDGTVVPTGWCPLYRAKS